MVSYQKRGKVWQYEISYKDVDGKYKKYRKSGFKLKSEAVLAASEVQATQPLFSSYNVANQTLASYFDHWIMLYKQNYVSNITFMKYQNTAKHIHKYFGNLRLKDLNKDIYQECLNNFAKTHAKRTVSCFHKHIRAALLDAIDEGIITKDPTRKAVVTGKDYQPAQKFLNYTDWQKLINNLNCNHTGELMIYLAALTGMRYGEIAGLTPNNINMIDGYININRTWDYKYRTGFKDTKNKSSRRKIPIDNHTLHLLENYIKTKNIQADDLIFKHHGKIYYSAQINNLLTNKLNALYLPRITFHGLRHTHASILLYKGVSVLSVSKRLGHSNTTTTQSTYLHIIKELEAKDNDKIITILDKSF
ncbi:site-specific integrase [Bombilactobacillus bombi]|uniref:site-specific integrase n=1 Tax=Bombilactobacillus bombi TaxID=1303590 RepID=UPI0015E5BA89|nr:tyrosine-type recombinase/integrase [Bombilactobacillus bombi]MBA1433798.1 site-specific integrase [Bombilactobacillus bombi]